MISMTKHKIFRYLRIVGSGSLLGLSLMVVPGLYDGVKAAEKTENSSSSPRQGLPGRRIGGGSRVVSL